MPLEDSGPQPWCCPSQDPRYHRAEISHPHGVLTHRIYEHINIAVLRCYVWRKFYYTVLHAELCPQSHTLQSSPPVPQTTAVFRGRLFRGVITFGVDLSQCDQCPYKKRLGHRQEQRAEGRRGRHREKTVIYKPRTEASEETSPAHTLVSDFQPRTTKK